MYLWMTPRYWVWITDKNAESLYLYRFPAFVLSNGSSLALFVGRVMYNYYRADADGHIREHRIIIGAMWNK